MSRTVWQLDAMDIIPSHSDGPWGQAHVAHYHTGHNKYRYFHETLRWPHGLQWALIFAWASWITTRAATGIWNCTSLLLGHMSHSCYKLTWKCDDHMGWIVYSGRPLYGHMGRYMYDGKIPYHAITFGRPICWSSPCGPLSLECGHTGHNRYRYYHMTHIWPHGIMWVLTHWGRDEMAVIFQTKFSNAFSWMKIYGFPLMFHWSLFLRVKLTIFQHWFR